MNNTAPAKRECGECTLCCHVLGIRELNKQPYKWCPNCKIGTGCQIYQDRPGSCRDFSCLWLLFPHLPEEMKPSKSGVVCWAPVNAKGVIFALTRKYNAEAWRKKAVHASLQRMAKAGHIVIACDGTRSWLIGVTRDIELPADVVTIDENGLNVTREIFRYVEKPPPNRLGTTKNYHAVI